MLELDCLGLKLCKLLESYLTVLCLNLLICKVRTIIILSNLIGFLLKINELLFAKLIDA